MPIQNIPVDENYARAMGKVAAELIVSRMAHPVFTTDPLRRAALVSEEAGEALQAALDMTRSTTSDAGRIMLRKVLYRELVQVAAVTLTALAAMEEEDSRDEANSDRPGRPVR